MIAIRFYRLLVSNYFAYFTKTIEFLKQQDRFRNDLPPAVPQAPRTTSETDAVGTLLDICVQRNWPLPM